MRTSTPQAIVLFVMFCVGGVTGWCLRPVVEPALPPTQAPVVESSPDVGHLHEITARTFPVHRVIDGDTIVIIYDGEPTSIRIPGIDTPERGESGFNRATEAMRELVEDQVVTIEFLDPDDKRDSFGRLLAHVYVDGVDVGEVMLERGLAEVYEE